MKRLILVLALGLACLALGGCKGPCLQLAQKICDCQTTSSLRDACSQQASQTNSQIPTTAADDARCSALVDKCNCHALDTAQGKIDCGMARPADWQ